MVQYDYKKVLLHIKPTLSPTSRRVYVEVGKYNAACYTGARKYCWDGDGDGDGDAMVSENRMDSR